MENKFEFDVIDDQFEIQFQIASGGYGTVFCCFDKRLQSKVAVKMLHASLSGDGIQRDQFLKEALWLNEIQEDLDCRDIIQIRNYGVHQGRPYFVMPYADKGSIQDLREQIKGAMIGHRMYLAGRVVRCLRSGMGALHSRGNGKLHRDIKPANILVKSDAEVTKVSEGGLVAETDRLWLGDLGLAKDLASQSIFLPGVGTRDYMAPEVTDFAEFDDSQVGPASDIYSATVTVIFALTGDVAQGAWQRNLRSLGFGENLINCLEAGVAPRQEDRFPTAEAWGDAVLRSLDRAAERSRTLLPRRRGDTEPQLRLAAQNTAEHSTPRRSSVMQAITVIWRWLFRALLLATFALLMFLLYGLGVISIDPSALRVPVTTATTTTTTTQLAVTVTANPGAEDAAGESAVGDDPMRSVESLQADVDALLAETGVTGTVTREGDQTIVFLDGTVVENNGLSRVLKDQVNQLEGVDIVLANIVVKPDVDPVLGANMRNLLPNLESIVFPDQVVAVEADSDQAIALEAIATYLKLTANEGVRVEIGGHADNTGRASTNREVSLARAESAKAFLVDREIAESRISVRAYGSSCPAASNDTAAGQAANRRVEVIIVGVDGSNNEGRPLLVCN